MPKRYCLVNLAPRFAVPNSYYRVFLNFLFGYDMAKPQTKRPLQQKNLDELRSGDAQKNPIPQKLRLPAAIATILVVLLVFFGKVLGPAKTFQAGDIIASESIMPYLNAAKADGQNVPQWIPNIFCGM